ncbi:MAG: hypothetical protein HY363_01710 [Candidatus Aenigmarchaeota archaeon]|nr:hypothetical protein [Candidatus Aenigmarchaeota archaeon]
MFTFYDWAYGISQIAAGFLALVAGLLAIWIFGIIRPHSMLAAWRYLLAAVVLFTVEEVLGALAAFGIYSTPYLTHVIPGFILAFLIAALVKQIYVNKGCA